MLKESDVYQESNTTNNEEDFDALIVTSSAFEEADVELFNRVALADIGSQKPWNL